MISARRGPIPGTASRSGNVIRATFAASLRTIAVGAIAPELALRVDRLADFGTCLAFAKVAAQASDKAAAVPEVAITSGTLPG